jgi:hypothetical protein
VDAIYAVEPPTTDRGLRLALPPTIADVSQPAALADAALARLRAAQHDPADAAPQRDAP